MLPPPGCCCGGPGPSVGDGQTGGGGVGALVSGTVNPKVMFYQPSYMATMPKNWTIFIDGKFYSRTKWPSFSSVTIFIGEMST